jgi:uncharacterized repeat protein (TIGR01451 family)
MVSPAHFFRVLFLFLLFACCPPLLKAAVFNIADGDVAGLIAAINTANGNAQADVINLASDGTYILTAVNNTTDGPNGLPAITGDSSALVINGNGATLRRQAGAPDLRFFWIGTDANVTLNDVRLENGNAGAASGGAIFNRGSLALNRSVLAGNAADGSGGGLVAASGSMDFTDSRFSGNQSGANGGAIHIGGAVAYTNLIRSRVSGNSSATNAGGITALSSGVVTILDSLVDGNTTAGNGGGIFTQTGVLEVQNSTISGNAAGNAGGGIAVASGGLELDQSTITLNQGNFGAGVFANPDLVLRVRNSIVAGNLTSQIQGNLDAGSANNIISASSPNLGPLASNGGPWPSHALRPNSSAIDAGNNNFAPGTTDTRGFARISGTSVDIGAVEFQQPLQLATTGSGQSANLETAFVNPLTITAMESNGFPISGVTINFSPPASGASASFPGGTSLVTGANGSVSAPVAANDTFGKYLVSAGNTGTGLTTQVSFNLINVGSDLSLDMSTSAGTAVPGESVTYTLVASNPGPAAISDAALTDTFPGALTCSWTSVPSGGASGNGNGAGDLFDVLNLPAGSSITYTIPCQISSSATGNLLNTASISSTGDPNPANNSVTRSVVLLPQADVSISKTDGQSSAMAGTPVEYTLVAANAGPSDAPGVLVTDAFPTELSGVSWTCSGAGGGTCAAAGSGDIAESIDLPAGSSVTFTASATIDIGFTGVLSNTASATVGNGVSDPFPGNNTATDTTTVTGAAPQFDYAPAPDSDIVAIGGTNFGSSGSFTITPSIESPVAGSGTEATTTLTCASPNAPFSGFDQVVSAEGNGPISGGPLEGNCTLAEAEATQLLLCSEDRGGSVVPRQWTLRCPAGNCPATVVSTLDDSGAGSLRQTIADACPGSVITFDAALGGGMIVLASPLEITKDLSIVGNVPITISGNAQVRVFDITGGNVSFDRLTIAQGSANKGGGIRLVAPASLSVLNSTLLDNVAVMGGGIMVDLAPADCSASPGLIVHNSTVSGNAAGIGAGIAIASGTAQITDSTVTANSATSGGGGLWSANDNATCTLVGNSLLAGGSGADVSAGDSEQRYVSLGHNLVGTAAGSIDFALEFNQPGDQTAVANALLAPLGNYGGFTDTHALLPGSPAIDSGTALSGSGNDQRGVVRGLGAGVDIGAFESQGFALSILGGSGQATLVSTPFAEPLSLAVAALDADEPVAGGRIEFIAPTTGASALPGASTTMIPADGMISTAVSANAQGGAYSVMASASGAATPASFELTNISQFSIGGTLKGLLGGGVALRLNGEETLVLNDDGPFAFATTLPDTSSYVVTVALQPTQPNQSCVVFNATGDINAANVTDVLVSCIDDAALVVSQPALQFTVFEPGEVSRLQSLTVTSAGAADLQIGDLTIEGAQAIEFGIVQSTCSNAVLAGGQSCIVQLDFAPAHLGVREAELVIPSNAASGELRVPLTGDSEGIFRDRFQQPL